MTERQAEIRSCLGTMWLTRVERVREVMAEYDRVAQAERRILQAECEALGHQWRFTHLGPLGDPWFICTCCEKTNVERSDG